VEQITAVVNLYYEIFLLAEEGLAVAIFAKDQVVKVYVCLL
jgi:hypothetical protein